MANNEIKIEAETNNIIELVKSIEFDQIADLFEALLPSLSDYFPNVEKVVETLEVIRQNFKAENRQDEALLEEVQGRIIDYLLQDDLLKSLIEGELLVITGCSPSYFHFEKMMKELNKTDSISIETGMPSNIKKILAILDQEDQIFLYTEYCNPVKKYINFAHFNKVMEIIFKENPISLDSLENLINIDELGELLNREPAMREERMAWFKRKLNESDFDKLNFNITFNDFKNNNNVTNNVRTKQSLLNALHAISAPMQTNINEGILNSNGKRRCFEQEKISNKKIKYSSEAFFPIVNNVDPGLTEKSLLRFDFLKKLFVEESDKLDFFNEVISFIAEKLTNTETGIEIYEITNRFGVLSLSFSEEKKQLLPKIKLQFDKLLAEFQQISDRVTSINDLKKELYKRYLGPQNFSFTTFNWEEKRKPDNIIESWIISNDVSNEEVFEIMIGDEIVDEPPEIEQLTEQPQLTDNDTNLNDKLKIKLYEKYFDKAMMMHEREKNTSISRQLTFTNC